MAGRLEEAATAYGQILQAEPGNAQALILFGLLHLQCGQFREADTLLAKAAALDPASFDALSLGAAALQQLGKPAACDWSAGIDYPFRRGICVARSRACEHPSLLANLKAKLQENRETMPLFGTARITRHLEAAYREMKARHDRGEPPQSFSVARQS